MTTTKCIHCGATTKSYNHRLTPGLVKALVKAARAVRQHGRNKFHLYHDLTGENELTTTEQMNWTKLRFHALVAKYKENGQWVRGYWVLTHRAIAFLRGDIAIPKSVETYRNAVVDHSTELVKVTDVFKDRSWFQRYEDYA